ncbi:MAG: hypothetical protein KDA84_07555 [Planctomycetaceae bacterium]|nr:hypothetical protein [Planctomycetaceae bacterium]
MTEHPLQPMVERIKDDPFFLAYCLSRFATDHGLDDATLANRLGCELDRLPHVMLCRYPDPSSNSFSACIRAIAEYVPCDAMALQAILTPSLEDTDHV